MVKAIATPNIALVKYWGKKDGQNMLPMNNSISLTLDEQLKCIADAEFADEKDEFVVNGKPANADAYRVLEYVRKTFDTKKYFKIISDTYFPVAGGLASSAAGFAAIAFSIAKLLGEEEGIELTITEISRIARMGSGSACRSVLGGAVEWLAGNSDETSYAVQLVPFEEIGLVDVIGILSHEEKKISSRAGMQQTVKTSKLYLERMKTVGKRLDIVRKALKEGDYETVLIEAMKDSDNMHACMMDTKPPLSYLNEKSLETIKRVNMLNEREGRIVCGYTFDAGPNAHIITESKNAAEAEKLFAGIADEIIVSEIGKGPRKIL